MKPTTSTVTIYDGKKDQGWLGDNQRWWFDPGFEHSFCYFDLDGFYEDTYYEADHVPPHVVESYVTHVLEYGQMVLGRPVRTILELGCASGFFTECFFKKGLDIIAVEGTNAGYRRTLARGVPTERVFQHDLRLPLNLNRSFDMVVCTEVAEHIECPLSGILVANIVNHARVAWFSFEEPSTNDAHYHHCNEQPEKFWVNLFGFYGFNPIRLPEEVTQKVQGRGDFVFYGRELQIPAELARSMEAGAIVAKSLGKSAANSDAALGGGGLKRLVKDLVPPLIWRAARSLKKTP